MPSVVTEVKLIGFGTERQECIDALDNIALVMLDNLGGAPWEMVDDDFKRIPAREIAPTLADSQGYCYAGVRSYSFKGPVVVVPSQPSHDGFKVQRASEG